MKNVTEQYKRDYLLRFNKFQQGREKFFAPHFYRKITQQYNQAIALVKQGLTASEVIHKLHPVGMNTLIMDLYIDAATIYGDKIRRDFKEQKNRRPIGFSEEIRKAIQDYFSIDVLNISEGIDKTTRDLIYKVITEGYQQGLSIDDIVKALSNTSLSRARSRLIARTETVTSANKGAFYVAEKTGLPLIKEWLSASDSRTRRDHITVNGNRVGMYEYFNVGGYNMLAPGDRGNKDGQLKVPSKEICNCRCTCLYIPTENNSPSIPVNRQPNVNLPIEDPNVFMPAKSLAEAKQRMNDLGVKRADIDSYSSSHYNSMLKALETVPKRALPTVVTDKQGYENFTGGKIKRKITEWQGMNSNANLFNRQTFTYSDEKIVIINTKGFKGAPEMTARKIEYNKYYSSVKPGSEWFFNKFDGSTHFHELGHVYDNRVKISTKTEWIDLTKRWYDETKIDLLKTTTGEFKGLNGSEAFAEAFASYYGNDKKGLPNYIIDFFIKNIK